MATNAVPFALPLPPAGLVVEASLFIDFDGTLVELVERPDAVCIDGELRSLLGALGRALPRRVALVSGRSIAQLDEMLGEIDPMLAYAGSHGSERRWHDGALHLPVRAAGLDGVVAAFDRFAASREGVLVEPKSYSVALHYRLAPAAQEDAHGLARALASEHGLVIQHSKMMVELKSTGADKGAAVRAFAARPEMAGRPPVFIGDDLTDEAGFEAAQALGGAGVLVGPSRQTAARFGLPDVTATRAWLNEAIGLMT